MPVVSVDVFLGLGFRKFQLLMFFFLSADVMKVRCAKRSRDWLTSILPARDKNVGTRQTQELIFSLRREEIQCRTHGMSLWPGESVTEQRADGRTGGGTPS